MDQRKVNMLALTPYSVPQTTSNPSCGPYCYLLLLLAIFS
jgi:hypothetical protein